MLEGIEAIVFRTVGDQPSLWESVLPEELRRLPEELARVYVAPVADGPIVAPHRSQVLFCEVVLRWCREGHIEVIAVDDTVLNGSRAQDGMQFESDTRLADP